ncbi:MAG: L-lactate permease [Bryobacteraceae bacterium]
MWPQNYSFAGGSLALSTFVAAIPILAMLLAIGVFRVSAWKSSLVGLAAAFLVAMVGYRMPLPLAASAAGYGGAFGIFPIFWIVYWAIVLYRLAIETGKLEILKDSIGHLTTDRSCQALLIAFSFGAFLEGAAGFGTPVAIAAAILAGLGFSPFYAAAICLLANTAPVAFGSIGIPMVTLNAITSLPLQDLSANTGRIVAPISTFIPAYLVLVMGGLSELKRVWIPALTCGLTFGLVQFSVSNLSGPYLTDILASLSSIIAVVLVLRFRHPAQTQFSGDKPSKRYGRRDLLFAWSPYLLLVFFVLLWSLAPVKTVLNRVTFTFAWPSLHNLVVQMPPVAARAHPYAAIYKVDWLAASGTSCGLSTLAAAIVLKVSPTRFLKICLITFRHLLPAFASFVFVLALAFLMNYSGATATLGLAFAHAGKAFPFFSALLGWVGVFLTGSDTSANALFGNLQQITALHLGMNPALLASSNSSGGVMGKMISLQSIAVASAATAMATEDEPKLFRFTLKHSLFLASVVGLVVLFYTYVAPDWAR